MQKLKIKDLFNPISNPSGGVTAAMLSVPGSKDNKNLSNIFNSVSPAWKGYGSTRMIDSGGNIAPKPIMAQPVAPVGPTRPSGGSGLPSPVGQLMVPPVTPTQSAVAPVATPNIPNQYKNTDGGMKTPEQVAAEIVETLKTNNEQGDVGKLFASDMAGGKTAEELRVEATNLNNIRNDIAVGETDPYGVGAKSGIAWTPEQLSAIEKAQAGVYDPAINTVFAKMESVQAEEQQKAKIKAEADTAEKEFANELKILAEKHKYDMEAMSKDQAFQKSLVGYKAALDAKDIASGMTAYSDERSQRTVQSIDELMGQVNGWTTGWGSLLSSIPSTDAKNFNSQLNTLKAAIAFGELTAMREASKTGGALGNVSNIELGLLESALAGLDSAQGPEDFKIQLTKAKDSINRWRQAQGAQPLGVDTNTLPSSSKILVSPTGETFDASDLTPEELAEAIQDGYTPR